MSQTEAHYIAAKEKLVRVSKALYLLTREWEDAEPLKEKIRSSAVRIMSFISARDPYSEHALVGLRSFWDTEREPLLDLLSLATVGRLLSHDVLSFLSLQFGDLTQSVGEPFVELPEQLVTARRLYPGNGSPNRKPPVVLVGHSARRENRVLPLMKGGIEYSIRDLAGAITGVSEKTVQRELAALVRAGRVIKKGERRWSVYRRADNA